MFYYWAYGLTIASEHPVDEFTPLEEKANTPDLTIHYGELSPPPSKIRFKKRKIFPYEGGIMLYWRRVGTYWVKDGSEVILSPNPATKGTGMVSAIIIGAVMGTVLFQREKHALYHSSVVGREDGLGAVAFSTASGGGKSTMATAMMNWGYSLVCDDLLVLEKDTVPLTAQPGFPGMKLWWESADALLDDGEELPLIGWEGIYEKRSRAIKEKFIDRRIKLSCLILLEYVNKSEAKIERLSQRDAFTQLVPHWYGSLFGGDFIPILGKERLFRDVSFLAGSGRVFKLTRPYDLERIGESVTLVDKIRKEG